MQNPRGSRPSIAASARTGDMNARDSVIRIERSLLPSRTASGKPTRFPGRQKPSQFRSVSEACRGLRTEFRPLSRVLRLNSPASLSPQNSVSRTTRWRGLARIRTRTGLDETGRPADRRHPIFRARTGAGGARQHALWQALFRRTGGSQTPVRESGDAWRRSRGHAPEDRHAGGRGDAQRRRNLRWHRSAPRSHRPGRGTGAPSRSVTRR